MNESEICTHTHSAAKLFLVSIHTAYSLSLPVSIITHRESEYFMRPFHNLHTMTTCTSSAAADESEWGIIRDFVELTRSPRAESSAERLQLICANLENYYVSLSESNGT
jgi:hypothetical protein